MGIKLPQICYSPGMGPGPREPSPRTDRGLGESLYRIHKAEMERDFRRSTAKSLILMILVIVAICAVSIFFVGSFK